MKPYFFRMLVLASLFILASSALAIAQYPVDLDRYIKSPSDSIRLHLGVPDEFGYSESNEAEIWTYYNNEADEVIDQLTILDSTIVQVSLAPQSLDLNRARTGFTQFAFWNGHVSAVSHVLTDRESGSFYERAILYLEEHSNWLGYAAGMSTYRITRVGDNTWTVYRTPEKERVQTVLTVGDAGYMACSKTDNAAEVERIKKQFGVSLRENQ